MSAASGNLCFIVIISILLSGIFQPVSATAQLYFTKAKQALLIDAATNTILFAKNHNVRIPPASLAKIMTMEVVFSRLKSGSLALEDTFIVSENAWRKGGTSSGGSTMFAKLNSDIRLDDLAHGVIVQSGNDASIVIAEGIAGSEAAFAGLMNERAKKIGLTNSNFRNSTGLPDADQYVTMLDMGKLARHVIHTYPEYYQFYSKPEFTWNEIKQRNRNPILKMDIGADGMKTGYTKASGYAIVASAIRDGNRLIAVLSGMTSKRQRAEETRKILDWGFRAFEKIELFKEGEIIGEADVYGGERNVPVVGKNAVAIYLPIGYRKNIRARISYIGPLVPPIEEGQKVALLKVWIGDTLSQETPLYAAESVNSGDLRQRVTDAVKELLLRQF
ncbi:MAG: D-alanyl-D-alanine carboxypeptidase [Hyphomicrobiales bacterium]|nr:D-alanyl-D-alanine carboxypeptidase [Hyphomicrobiales bacterium]